METTFLEKLAIEFHVLARRESMDPPEIEVRMRRADLARYIPTHMASQHLSETLDFVYCGVRFREIVDGD